MPTPPSKPNPVSPPPAISPAPAAAPGPNGTAAPPGPSGPPSRRFDPKAPVPTASPRKVRGGLKLETKTDLAALAWAGQRWFRLVEDHAPNAALAEGVTYARGGQARSLAVHAGRVEARVQGRLPNAYNVDIRLPTFTHEQWEQATSAMTNEARFLAAVLSGEVPSTIEDLFAPLHLRLFPVGSADLTVSCNCGWWAQQALAYAKTMPAPPPGPITVPDGPWCKHVSCVMALLAERLSRDPFLIFELRGLAKEELLERLRQRRAVIGAARAAGGAGRPVPAYVPRIPGVGEEPATPLEHLTSQFWRPARGLEDLDLSMDKPPASHVLLRRLGASPFDQARFPLVGLMATCYDVLADAAVLDPGEVLAPKPEDSPAEDAPSGDAAG